MSVRLRDTYSRGRGRGGVTIAFFDGIVRDDRRLGGGMNSRHSRIPFFHHDDGCQSHNARFRSSSTLSLPHRISLSPISICLCAHRIPRSGLTGLLFICTCIRRHRRHIEPKQKPQPTPSTGGCVTRPIPQQTPNATCVGT